MNPLSKNKQKYIRSLETKKARTKEGAFVVEGTKSVHDMIVAGFVPLCIVAENEWYDDNSQLVNNISLNHKQKLDSGESSRFSNKMPMQSCEMFSVTAEELRRTSFLQHPQHVLAVFAIPKTKHIETDELFRKELVLMLDGVQDPGNLGTIIRIADWFGIKHVICSQTTVDAFAPKVVQATMGSIARVEVAYINLLDMLSRIDKDIPVYGTLLDGENIYTKQLSSNGIIIMGNEGNGISNEVRKYVSERLLIPSYPADSPTAESLNVSIATAITVAEFRRRTVI